MVLIPSMFNDVRGFHDFSQLKLLGAQEYEDKFKKNFGFGINKKIGVNERERYNPKNDFTINPPLSYTDSVRTEDSTMVLPGP